jgi:acyl-CoA synthetase (AMP-forming)/AMP-acid ligase II
MQNECVELSGTLDHEPSAVWRIVGSPELYPRFARAVSRFDKIDPDSPQNGARHEIVVCIDDARFTDEVRALVYRPDQRVVWRSTHDEERWFSLSLAEADRGGTVLSLRVTLPPGAEIAGVPLGKGNVRRRLQSDFRETVQRIDHHLVGMPEVLSGDRGGATNSRLNIARTLADAGVLALGRPDRMIRQLAALTRWGPTLAGGYQASTARFPDDGALVDEEASRTFTDVDEFSTRLAHGLAERGVDSTTSIAFMCRNHGGFVESLIACAKLGADAVLLNTGMSTRQVSDVLTEHKVGLVLSDDEFAGITDDMAGVERISTWPERDSSDETIDDVADTEDTSPWQPPKKDGRLIVLTSGTTGAPKGAKRRNPKGLGDAAAVLSRIPLQAAERMLVAAPLFHTWGLAAMQLGMALHAQLVLHRRFDAEAALQAIEENRCTSMFAVPIMLQRMLDLPIAVRAKYDTSSLRIVASSGSAMPASLVTGFMKAFGSVLYNLYGSTEVSWASVADPADLHAAPKTAGRPPAGTRVGILNDDGRPAPPGAVGRIFVGNDMLFEGYTNGALTEIEHALMGTGDRGYLDADGRLFVVGRDDEMIVSGGENVFPRPVEEVLVTLPQVNDVAVIGVPDAEYGQRLAAYIVLAPGARLNAENVRTYVHDRLARFYVPRDVEFIDEIPRNATGKTVKRELVDGGW